MKTPQTAEEYEAWAVEARLVDRYMPFGQAAAIIARHLRGENVDELAKEMSFNDAADLKRALDSCFKGGWIA